MAVLKLKDGQSNLPSRESTSSYWHREPSQKLLGHRTTDDLPPTADVIVVGSGITGAFAARELVAGGKSVVMLEAREACWGATGRNGGHCQPFFYASKPHIAAFELATYTSLKSLIESNKIPCDWRTVGGVASLPDQETLDVVSQHLQSLSKTHPELAAKALLFTEERDLERLRVRDAKAAVLQPNAAKCWPYKLVAWVLEKLLDENMPAERKFNLQTNTPALSLQREGASWIVHTERGQIAAKDVLLATNAYTSYLLPKLSDLIIPTRGQVCALVPPEGSKLLEHTHMWHTANNDVYLIQRNSGELIIGGERWADAEGQVGISEDDTVSPVIGEALRGALAHAITLKPGSSSEEPTLAAKYEWTGIMGYSKDAYPWVGRVPSSLGGGEGLWISGGYTGHGMPVAARCAVAIVEDILGREKTVDVPKEYQIEKDRLERAKVMKMPVTLLEELKYMLGHGL